jgi:hypothetical protein
MSMMDSGPGVQPEAGPPSDAGVTDTSAPSDALGEAATLDGGTSAIASGSVFGLSSVPPTGPAEMNPYGLAIVPAAFPTSGTLQPGDMLFSNFNDADNVQGTGTTIVRVTPAGVRSTFFTSAQTGLSAALAVLQGGLVVTGNVPNVGADGGAAVGSGALQVLDASGKVLQTLTDPALLADPWALTVHDMGATAQIFVSNVVSGVVTRLDVAVSATALTVNDKLQIASGYATRTDPAAFVVGPGGMVYDAPSDTLYLASSAEKVGGTEVGTIFAVASAGARTSSAGMGTVVFADPMHLHGPIGLVRAPNGDLVTANSDAVNADPMQPSTLVQFTTQGQYVGQLSVDPGNGAAFGLTVGSFGGQSVLAALNDNQATLTIRPIP